MSAFESGRKEGLRRVCTGLGERVYPCNCHPGELEQRECGILGRILLAQEQNVLRENRI